MKSIQVSAFAGVLALVLAGCQKEDLAPTVGGTVGTEEATDDAGLTDKAGGGTVFTLSNQTAGNDVVRYHRAPNGMLNPTGTFSTGGFGTGGGLGSQGALILSDDGNWLLAVNAGSNSLSVMRSTGNLHVVDITPTSGAMPISVCQRGRLVYVLSSGGEGNISGFRLANNGRLTPIPDSFRKLSTFAPGPAQISFNSSGTALIVTEKGTNSITTYKMNNNGTPGEMHNTPSAGQTPFGFAVGAHNLIYVSEAAGGAANGSTVSTYRVDANANVTVVDGPRAISQTAACWALAVGDGSTIVTTNTGSGTMSSLQADQQGHLTLTQSVAVETGMGSRPIDAAVSRNGRYVYALGAGSHAIHALRLNNDGTLTQLEQEGDLLAGTVGLAAR